MTKRRLKSDLVLAHGDPLPGRQALLLGGTASLLGRGLGQALSGLLLLIVQSLVQGLYLSD